MFRKVALKAFKQCDKVTSDTGSANAYAMPDSASCPIVLHLPLLQSTEYLQTKRLASVAVMYLTSAPCISIWSKVEVAPLLNLQAQHIPSCIAHMYCLGCIDCIVVCCMAVRTLERARQITSGTYGAIKNGHYGCIRTV